MKANFHIPLLSGSSPYLSPGSMLFVAVMLVFLPACRTPSPALVAPPAPRAVQPGAPGQPTRILSEEELARDVSPRHTAADVAFMQGMIAHHAQALEMTALLPGRTEDRELGQLALRIEISQRDEIRLMQDWLRQRGESVPEIGATEHMHHGGEHGGNHAHMPGMLSAEQMERLKASSGDTFYRLFLEYMIQHHEGALYMVSELFSNAGAGQDTEVYRFAADVDADQEMEISRMRGMLNRSK